ncbi:UNC-like C-terminal-domain-containing protein [Dendryphion nanum]|uniref:UNC-like C-terminal-domain-containing protein n=1 Tax=Dendryphion nanum TaxID=256645 RepID=A0A9P9DDN3_9PLEO|nr:UNC-like C-terminal-domain-containing protein [Dendryphion nanum]
MPAIGATLCTWTTLLLLCSLPTSAQPANETIATASTTEPSSASSKSSNSLSPSSARASVTPSPLQSSNGSHSYSYVDSTCAYRTINYITHTLPQQCLRTGWSSPLPATQPEIPGERIEELAAGVGNASSTSANPGDNTDNEKAESHGENERDASQIETPGTPDDAAAATASATNTQPEPEVETDSPFDNANFLSFEEWKKQNLARAGQSPENVGQGRAASPESRNRQRPVNINALDALGEESEIEIDFSGFGHAGEGEHATESSLSGTRNDEQSSKPADAEGNVAPTSFALSKDAGKTCKERFNYASFDCAATVLKTNSKVKGSSAVLVENKDSYMLNECSVDNKFVIVELCDDILVDTVVLANYEFFSSMFRHFRVSVSDRYPVKLDRWRTLGTFEARNSRDIQPFLITEPQIWARYLRLEFLTHFGNEFYCPVSLLRVHGTTMMEQFRREEEEARGDDDFAEPIEAGDGDPVKTAVAVTAGSGAEKAAEQLPIEPNKAAPHSLDGENNESAAAAKVDPTSHSVTIVAPDEKSKPVLPEPEDVNVSNHGQRLEVPVERVNAIPRVSPHPQVSSGGASKQTSSHVENSDTVKHVDTPPKDGSPSSITPPESRPTASVSSGSQDNKPSSKSTDDATNMPPGAQAGRGPSNSTSNGTPPQARSPSQSQPNPPSPTTQESFFKSISKRLQNLEANSTLSLQYIEEQSRILRDAFMKVEKRQLTKTEKFLDHLNSTVMHELKAYRNMYDQLWQSTILELESMKERQKAEIGEIGTRLSMVADELVWQKRMAVVQSTLLLLCLGLVLFVRSGTLGSQSDMPIVQTLGSTYSRFFESPPGSPDPRTSVRRRRTFRNIWRSDTSAGFSERSGGHLSDGAETDDHRSPLHQVSFHASSPGTPSGLSHQGASFQPLNPDDNSSDSDQAKRMQFLATQSGPATPNGTRDSRPSWEEVDRAVDQLIAEEQHKAQDQVEHERVKRKKRSPLRRAQSYSYDDSGKVLNDIDGDGDGDVGADDSPEDDGAEGLYSVG